ncbi:MAG: hypothetical protein AAF805_04400, partial [Planctomycetota bacterium]
MRLTHANALVWALGNGLVSTTLVIYLALEMGAGGVAIAWLLAAPRFAGVLRVAAPAIVNRASASGLGRKGVCLAGYAASGVAVCLVPTVAWSGGGVRGVGVLAAAWCVYHLLEYVATVALWSWIGDLYPRRARSRLLGHRERWLVIGRLIGVGVSVALAALWGVLLTDASRWAPLAASASIGAALMLLALVPLAFTRPMATTPSAA